MDEVEKSVSYSSKSSDMNYENGSQQESLGPQVRLDYQESVSSHFRHAGFFIDQTPTPTRFFKHYEDVSLFQDINLNPFDLEFRKASQNKSSKIYLTVNENHGISGSLDTPRILPPVESDETISSTSHEDSHIQVSASRVHSQLSSLVTPVVFESEILRQNSLNVPSPERNEGRKKLTLNVSSASEDGQSSNIISTPTPVITAGPSVSQALGVGNLTPILNTPTIVTSNIPHISLNGVELGDISSPVLGTNFRISSPLPNEHSKNNRICEGIETSKPSLQSATVSAQRSVPSSTISYSSSTTTSTSPQSATVLQLLLRLPNGQSIPVEIPATPVVSSVPTGTSSPALATSIASVVPAYPATAFTSVITNPTPSLAKLKLKQVLSTSNTAAKPGSLRLSRATTADRIADLTKNRTSTVSSNNRPTNIGDGVKGSNTNDGSGPKGTRRRKSSPDEDPEEKRKKFLERNRVAAVRCREKKKRLVETMFARTDELNVLNQKLQAEVVSLRSEVAALKCLLLKHKTCPVTLAMQGREGCFTDSNIGDIETPIGIESSSCITQASIVQPAVQNINNTSIKVLSQNVAQDSASFIVSKAAVASLDETNKVRKRSHSLSSISYPVPLQSVMVNAQNVSGDAKLYLTIDGIKKEPKHILPKDPQLLSIKNSLGNSLSMSSSSSSTSQSSALPFSDSKFIVIENHNLNNDAFVSSER